MFLHSQNSRVGIISILKNTIKKEGFFGLYSGIRFDFIRIIPANTITFLTFEFCKNKLETKLKFSKN